MPLYILGNDDTQCGIEGQHIFSDDELRNMSLIKRRKIGHGAFGNVYLCENQDTGTEMAMKQVDISYPHKKVEEQVRALHREMEILRKINHKHIVRYFGMLQDKDSISILLEYVKGGTIRDLISSRGALQEKIVGKYCQQILKGLAYLHENKIVHRDLKCANILLEDYNNCKLTDFGVSKHDENVQSISGCDTITGSIYWMSPESIQGKRYGNRSDIWSFGCTVLEMLNTEPPFRKFSIHSAVLKIVQEELVPCFPCSTSDHCKLFVKACFHRNDKLRPAAEELLGYEFVSVCNKS